MRPLRQIVNIFAATYASLLALYLVLSQFLAPIAPFTVKSKGAPEGFAVWFARLPLPQPIQRTLCGESLFRNPHIFGAVYLTLLSLVVICWVSLLFFIFKNRENLTEETPPLLFKWSVFFALILVFATPVLVHDFWLSIGWGREVAHGINPYYTSADGAWIEDLPKDRGNSYGLMTYGPLWALVSGLLASFGGSAILSAFFFKIVITAAWIAAVWAVAELVKLRPLVERCIAIVLFGWAPLGLIHAVADGHNDILMIFLLLLWMLYLRRKWIARASLALAASVLIKYCSAPLFALHVVRLFKDRTVSLRRKIGSLIAAAFLMICVTAVFYRSSGFFSAMAQMHGWRFLTPAVAVEKLLGHTGAFSHFIGLGTDAAILFFAAVTLWNYFNNPSEDSFQKTALVIMNAVLLAAVGHVWPWFVLWALAFAAVQPFTVLSFFVFGLSAAMTLFYGVAFLVGLSMDAEWHAGLAVAVYAIALLVTIYGYFIIRSYRNQLKTSSD